MLNDRGLGLVQVGFQQVHAADTQPAELWPLGVQLLEAFVARFGQYQRERIHDIAELGLLPALLYGVGQIGKNRGSGEEWPLA